MNLDRRIELHELVTSRNTSGQYVKSFQLVNTVAAALNPSYSSENNSGDQLYGFVVVRFVIRYNTDVKHTWRVKHNGDTYDIVGILPDGRRVYSTLICRIRDNEP